MNALEVFTAFIATIIYIIKDDLLLGIEIVYTADGRLFKLAGFRSRAMAELSLLTEFQFADGHYSKLCETRSYNSDRRRLTRRIQIYLELVLS